MENINEYQILTHLQSNELTSQRKIATRTGLSLGAVNVLIKKMVRKGLIKVEKLNARTVRYILTPQGMKEKAKLTYHYVRRSYRQIIEITEVVEELVETRNGSEKFKQVVIFGPPDEVEQILKSCLKNLNLPYQVWSPDHAPEQLQDNQLVLIWRHDEEEKLAGHNNVANIMQLI